MDIGRLKDILASFATSRGPDPKRAGSGSDSRGTHICKYFGQRRSTVRHGRQLLVAGRGALVAQRIAQMDFLAERLMSLFPSSGRLVKPREVLSSTKLSRSQTKLPSPWKMPSYSPSVSPRRPGGTRSVLYLTSDAGEGKTTLIGRIAGDQARAYKAKKTDWLLVPINLGGNPFLRLDNALPPRC